MEQEKFLNLHEIIKEIQLGSLPAPEEALPHGSFRLEDGIKEQASQILKTNGTNLSAFMRGCCLTLVREYR